MAREIEDFVRDTATNAGTGAFAMANVSKDGFRTFQQAHTIGIPFEYTAHAGAQKEVGTGILQADGTISRTPLRSTASNNGLVDFTEPPTVFETVSGATFRAILDAIAQLGPHLNPADVGFDIVLCGGQSNMAGRGAYDALIDVPDDRVWQFGADSAQAAYYQKIFSGADPLHMREGVATGKTGPATSFARAYAATIPTNRRVLLIPLAKGATGLVGGDWAPGTPGATLYENAIAQANLAITAAKVLYPNSRVVGTIWAQGENDAVAGVAQAAHAAALKALIAGFRSRITGAADSWFIIGGMVPERIAAYPTQYNPIVAAHQQVATETDKCAYVPGPTGYAASGDTIHYTSPGSRILGARMALAVAAAKTHVGVPVEPEDPVAATGVTLTGPAGGVVEVVSSNFSVGLTPPGGTVVGSLAVTPSDNGGGGSFSPASVFLTAAAPNANFTYTPSATPGARTISVTNNGGLTNPASITYTSTPAAPAATEPAAPTIGMAVAGDGYVDVAYTANSNGGAAIIDATATLSTGETATGTTSPIRVTASNGVARTAHVTVRNSVGSSPASAESNSVTPAAPPPGYYFESDTIGAAPAGITVTGGTMEVVNASVVPGWTGKALHFKDPKPATGSIHACSLDNIPVAADRTVIWKRGAAPVGGARDAMMIRTIAGSVTGYAGARFGYLFQTSGSTNNVRLYKLVASGATSIGSAVTLADAASRWFRASAIGATLKLDYSDDNKATWTNLITATDATYASGGVDYVSGFNGEPTQAYLDDITWS